MLYDLRTLFNLFATSLGVTNIDSVPTPDVAQQQLVRLAQAAQGGAGAQGAGGAAGGAEAQPQGGGIPTQAASPEAQMAEHQAQAQAQAAAAAPTV